MTLTVNAPHLWLVWMALAPAMQCCGVHFKEVWDQTSGQWLVVPRAFHFQPVLSPLTRGRVRHSACATLLAECRTSVPGIESAKEVGGNKCAQRRRGSSHRFLLALRPRRSASLCISSLPIKQYSLKVRRCRGWEITWWYTWRWLQMAD